MFHNQKLTKVQIAKLVATNENLGMSLRPPRLLKYMRFYWKRPEYVLNMQMNLLSFGSFKDFVYLLYLLPIVHKVVMLEV